MKRVFEKFLITLLIIMMLTNFIAVRPIYATTNEKKADFIDGLVGLLGGLVGILTLPERITAINVADAMNSLTAVIAYVDNEDSTVTKDSLGIPIITPYEILFNKVKIVEINFFDITDASGDDAGALVNKVRKGVAGWYYAMRNIAAAILLCILVYVGIRMAISTIASDRAMYKKMLVDWVCSLVLIFVLQYIMIFTIYVNNAIVNAINLSVGGDQVAESFAKIKDVANDIFNINALAATIVYCMLIWQTLGLFIAYFNRMIKLAFLIIISPLISITYSIDKIGDGKAQALGNWLKEFVFTILMQPFHCAIYMCMVDTAMDLLVKSAGGANKEEALGVAIVAILSVRFIKEGEKIVRKIFSFADDNKSTSLAAGMVASSMALSKARNIGHTAKNVGRGAINFAKNLPEGLRNGRIETVAMAKYLFTNTGDKSFSDVKAEVKEKADNKSADRLEKYNDFKAQHIKRFKSTALGQKIRTAKAVSEGKEKISADKALKEKMINEKAQEKMNASAGTMTESQARAEARRDLAREEAKERSAFGPGRRMIRGVKRFNKKHSSAVIAELKNLGKEKMATGVGMAIGAGLYGSGKDFVTSMTSGAAIKGAVGEFLSGNQKDIMNDSKKQLNHLKEHAGIDDSGKLNGLMNELRDNPDKFTPGTEKAEEELDKLSAYLDQLEDSGIAPNIKSRIKNEIETDTKNAPDSINDMMSRIKKNAVKRGDTDTFAAIDQLENSDEHKALMAYASKCSLNTSYQEAMNSGMKDSEFELELKQDLGFEDEYDPVLLKNRYKLEQRVEDVMQGGKDKVIKDATEYGAHKLKQLGDAFDYEIASAEELKTTLEALPKSKDSEDILNKETTDIIKELEERIARLKSEKADVIAGALANRDATLKLGRDEIATRYKHEIETKIAELQEQVKNNANDTVKLQLERLKSYQISGTESDSTNETETGNE